MIADLKDEKDCTVVSALEDQIRNIIRKEKSKRADELNNLVQSMLKATSPACFEKAFQDFTSYVIKHKLIKNDAFNFDLLKELYQFRNHLEPKGLQTTGKHFNHAMLAEAAQLYDQNYERFGNDGDRPKIVFCWQKIFGGIQRHVPACDAQCMAQGLSHIMDYGAKSQRSLNFTYNGGKYYPLNFDPDWEIGHNCIGVDGALRETGWWKCWPCCPSTWWHDTSLMSRKNSSASAFAAALRSVTAEEKCDNLIVRRCSKSSYVQSSDVFTHQMTK